MTEEEKCNIKTALVNAYDKARTNMSFDDLVNNFPWLEVIDNLTITEVKK